MEESEILFQLNSEIGTEHESQSRTNSDEPPFMENKYEQKLHFASKNLICSKWLYVKHLVLFCVYLHFFLNLYKAFSGFRLMQLC